LSVVELEPEILVPEHTHENEQVGVLLSGSLLFTIDESDANPGREGRGEYWRTSRTKRRLGRREQSPSKPFRRFGKIGMRSGTMNRSDLFGYDPRRVIHLARVAWEGHPGRAIPRTPIGEYRL
jgi:hypothetical protein